MDDQDENIEVKRLLLENQRLLIENNQLLRRMRRNSIIAFIFRMIWFVILFGSIYYVYNNHIQPNWENLEASIEAMQSINFETEGAKNWFESVKSGFQPPIQ